MNERSTVLSVISQLKRSASSPVSVQVNWFPVSVSVMVPASKEPVPEFSWTVMSSSPSAAWYTGVWSLRSLIVTVMVRSVAVPAASVALTVTEQLLDELPQPGAS